MGREKGAGDTQAREGLVAAVLFVRDEVPAFLWLKIHDAQHQTARVMRQDTLKEL
jgi:hypothetical protein